MNYTSYLATHLKCDEIFNDHFMPAGCNCGPNSPLTRALGCQCVRRGTAVIASQLPLPRL